jgi:AcrR family transcriptional regulator
MRRRAESQLETRRRITESAVELHGTVGPAHTTMSAVAERAGVRRSTLYRHFPDEDALFDACSAHWSAANPPPDPAAWGAAADPEVRLRVALADLYDYYRRNARMIENLLRDEETVEALRERLSAFHTYIGAAGETLLRGTRARGAARRRTAAAIGHALAFGTWHSLVAEQSLPADDAVALMCDLVASAQRSR